MYQNFLNGASSMSLLLFEPGSIRGEKGGDWMLDSGPQLSKVIDAGVRTHILCGDA